MFNLGRHFLSKKNLGSLSLFFGFISIVHVARLMAHRFGLSICVNTVDLWAMDLLEQVIVPTVNAPRRRLDLRCNSLSLSLSTPSNHYIYDHHPSPSPYQLPSLDLNRDKGKRIILERDEWEWDGVHGPRGGEGWARGGKRAAADGEGEGQLIPGAVEPPPRRRRRRWR